MPLGVRAVSAAGPLLAVVPYQCNRQSWMGARAMMVVGSLAVLLVRLLSPSPKTVAVLVTLGDHQPGTKGHQPQTDPQIQGGLFLKNDQTEDQRDKRGTAIPGIRPGRAQPPHGADDEGNTQAITDKPQSTRQEDGVNLRQGIPQDEGQDE